MDAYNHFESDITFKLTRLENLVALFVSLALFIAHIGEVRWLPAVLLFVYIDVIGYIPGLIAERRSLAGGGDGRISKVYYVLYNIMHTWITQAVVIGLWGWIFGFEWALLVIPIHLCGDRSVFGNSLKPFSIPFDSKAPIPEFADFRGRLAGGALTGPRAERTAR